jgi:hypothetical protein
LRPRFAVEFERARAEELAQRPRDRARLHFHLEEPVARVHPAERAVRVIEVRREDVWHGAVIEAHVDSGAEAADRVGLAGGQVGLSHHRPDTVYRIEKPSERRAAADRHESDVEQSGEHDGRERDRGLGRLAR